MVGGVLGRRIQKRLEPILTGDAIPREREPDRRKRHNFCCALLTFNLLNVTYVAALLLSQHGRFPFLQQAAAVLQHEPTCAVSQQPLSSPDFTADLSPFFIMGHLSPQHDLPSAILPSLPIGHLSPDQHGQPLALSPVTGAAGVAWVAVCATNASANSIVTTTIVNFVFIISSSLYELFPILAREDEALCPPVALIHGTTHRYADAYRPLV